MASTDRRIAVAASHTPAALKKAAAARAKGYALKSKLAAKYNLPSSAFAKPSLLSTCKAHGIPLSDLPVEIFSPFNVGERKRILGKTNGHAAHAGIGIPLDAIPERPTRKTANGGSGNYLRPKGHPNSLQIDKLLDLLARPDLSDTIAERLLKALDKLIG